MPGRQLRTVLHFLRQVSDFSSAAQQSDGQLLRRFIDRRDAAAFAVLVQRHGPLVLSVCRRVLPNPQDAEDAFQATFLVLVRKARSIARQESVGSWLHGVARRIAVRAKGDIARRRACERQAPRLPPPDTLHEVVWRDLREMIDEEVLRLPARCREPFVLCYLEGRTNEEAAQRLGCPKGTVQSRLAKARELLRARLARRGLVVSAGLVATLLPSGAASSAVPAALVKATVSAAGLYAAGRALTAGAVSAKVIALTEGVLQAMFLTKLKIAATVLAVVGAVGLTAGVPAFHAFGVGQAEGKQAAPQGEPVVGTEETAQARPGSGDGNKAPATGQEPTEFQVVKLRFMKAREAKRIIEQLFGPTRGAGIGFAIEADERTNSVTVRADPHTLAVIGEIIQNLDAPPANLERSTHSYGPFKYVSAAHVAAILQEVALGSVRRLRLTTDDGANRLHVATDPETHKKIAAIIQKLDVPPEKKAQAARDEQKAFDLMQQIKIYPLKNRTPAQIKAVLEKLFPDEVEKGGLALAVEEDTKMLIVRTNPTKHDVFGAIIERLDVGAERVPPEKKPQEPPAPRPQLPEGVGPPPVAAGAPLDLVNLATAYIEAVRSREIARLKFERVEKLKGTAFPIEEAEIARIDLQAAERKVALFRAIAEAAYEGAQSELAAVKSRHQVGQALANQVAAAEAKVKMLKSILDSAK